MKLDFRVSGKINTEHLILFNQIAQDIRVHFTELIESLSLGHENDLDWWVSTVPSRNPFNSPLFKYCCFLAYLKELIEKKEFIEEIVTDSRAFKKVIEQYLETENLSIHITCPSYKEVLKKSFRLLYSFFRIPLTYLNLFIQAKRTSVYGKPVSTFPITLIDTFFIPGVSETKDHYYQGILELISDKERESIYFVPTWVSPKKCHQLIPQLRTSKKLLLLKEDYLSLSDYLFAWSHLFRLLRLNLKPQFFLGFEILPLIKEELWSFSRFNSSFTALLNYRFSKRLKQADIQVRLVIDWFENQILDKGWNMGFRTFFPEIPIVGYQGFIGSSHYLSLYSTSLEKKNKLIPHEVSVIGKGLIPISKQYCSDLNISVAPAFRFQWLWNKRKSCPDFKSNTVLIALSTAFQDGSDILHLVVPYLKELTECNIHIKIKPHPATTPGQVKQHFGANWPSSFEFVYRDFNECIERASLLISNSSTTCMEALAKGIPVILAGSQSGLTYNPIPESIPEDIWRLCYTEKEMFDAIQFYINRDEATRQRHEKIGQEIRKNYFTPVTPEAVRRFLKLPEQGLSNQGTNE